MSNIQSMTIEQLNGYREYLNNGVSLDHIDQMFAMFDGQNFADLIELHDYCRERLAAIEFEISERKRPKGWG